MRFQSKKQAAIYREWSPKRRLWLQAFPQCFICGYSSTEVHEIFNGPLRMKAFVVQAAWLAVCTDCNQNELTNKKAYPIERQLAYKLHHDHWSFDLAKCREIIAPRQIDLDVLIIEYLKLMRE